MRKLLSLFTVLLTTFVTTAQTRPITGRITDNQGQPVEGASVFIKGTTTGTAADAGGNFRINAKTGDVLVISATNFGSREVAVTSSNNYNVSLVRQVNSIDEVVVTALGITRQRRELGYSTATIRNTELTQAKPVSVTAGLQGKVSGLNITTINNSVFADVKINLRGIRSLTGNNNPMLLLDGVPFPLRYLSSINPNDVQSVDILKGSSAAGVYGPDARNGVIVVTTKKGTSQTPVITLSQTTQVETIAFLPEMQESFGSGGYGEYIPYENWSWGPAFDGTIRELGHELPDGSVQTHVYSAKPDEKKKFFNTAVTNQTDVSFAAKDFYISVQDVFIQGIVPDDQNHRTGVRVNTGKEFGKFKVQFNVNYVQQNYDIFDNTQMSNYYTAQNVGLNDGLLNLIFSTPPNIPITSYKDFQNDKFSTYNNYFNDYGINPYFAIDNWRQEGKNDDLITNIELNLNPLSWLNLTYRAGATVNNFTARGISKGEVANAYGQSRGITSIPGAVSEYSTRSSRLSSEFFATANKTFGDFRLNVIGGTYFRQTDSKTANVSATSLTVPELFTVNNLLGSLIGNSSISRTRVVAAYGILGFNYKGWANLEVTGRNEWTSLLSFGQHSFFYPGASASLILSDAIGAIKESRIISFLKLRGAVTETGNADIAPYSLSSTFGNQSNGFPYGTLPGYTANNIAYDPNLVPERTLTTEVGLDMGFLRNRINLEVTYYHQNNKDQFLTVPVSNATGYTSLFRNAGSFINQGVEVDLHLTPLVKLGSKGSFDFSANVSYNTSEVTELYQDLDRIQIGGYAFAANYAIVDQPAFVWLASDYERDDQGRVIINPENGYPNKDPNNKMFGRTMPLWIVGLTPSINWDRFTFSVVGEYRGGHYNYNHIGAEMAWTGISKATATNNRERFVIPNSVYWDGSKYVPNTNIAIENVNDFYTGNNTFRQVATNFLTSAASWRIREVSLGYDVPVSIFGKQNVVKRLTVALNARNLFLWLPKSNEFTDPDFNFTTGNTSGVNNATINPPTRIFGANITVTF